MNIASRCKNARPNTQRIQQPQTIKVMKKPPPHALGHDTRAYKKAHNTPNLSPLSALFWFSFN